MSSWQGGGAAGHRGGIWLWPGVGNLNYHAVPGVGIFEFLFVPVTTNHFPGWGISVTLTSHFCLGVGYFTAIFGNVKCLPYTPPAPPPPQLDIDRCITKSAPLTMYFPCFLKIWHLCSVEKQSKTFIFFCLS